MNSEGQYLCRVCNDQKDFKTIPALKHHYKFGAHSRIEMENKGINMAVIWNEDAND